MRFSLVPRDIARRGLGAELALPFLVAALLAAMMVPLPSWLLDVGLALNLAASAALLIAALTVKDPLEVTAFPTLLLVTTLLRLAMNVSSTRLALTEGQAGRVISAFGELMVRGDYLVGAVVFVILSLVQFIVVAKGAERVAEVSARFMLDAMPGKQLSIDADLRAGVIDSEKARQRRRALERESQMFGAMDGAMKFVKGDVIAGFIIVGVNFLAGLAVGVTQNGMDAREAASTYGLIALGDGLVSQIASLCVTVAAGLLVTRVGSEQADGGLGREIGRQFFGEPRVMGVVGGLLLALALVPGMPSIVFLVMGAGVLGGGVALGRKPPSKNTARLPAREGLALAGVESEGKAKPGSPGGTPALVMLDLGAQWSDWAGREDGKLVSALLARLRERFYREMGVVIPGIRVRTSAPGLPDDAYAMAVDDVPAGAGRLAWDGLYASCRPEELTLLGQTGTALEEPGTRRVLMRVTPEAVLTLERVHIQVRRGEEHLLEHLTRILVENAALLMGVQEVQSLLDGLEPVAPALVRTVVEKVSLPLLTDVLRGLLQENVSIRNFRTLLEALARPATEGDAGQLADVCRQALRRQLSHRYAPSGMLYAYLLDPEVEDLLREQLQRGAVEPGRVVRLMEGMRRVAAGGRAVVLTAPDVRRPLQKLCEGNFPQLAVLAFSELGPRQQVQPVGRLSLAA